MQGPRNVQKSASYNTTARSSRYLIISRNGRLHEVVGRSTGDGLWPLTLLWTQGVTWEDVGALSSHDCYLACRNRPGCNTWITCSAPDGCYQADVNDGHITYNYCNVAFQSSVFSGKAPNLIPANTTMEHYTLSGGQSSARTCMHDDC